MTIEQYVATYGYLAIFIGVFLEGEAVVMTGGFLAHSGLLELHWVIVSAFFGSIITYHGFFLLGRTRGHSILLRRPRWRRRVARLRDLLHRHHMWVIFGYRLLFGFRSVTPFALGMTGLSYQRFLVFDLAPAAAWSVGFSLLGYTLGKALDTVLAHLEQYRLWIASGFIVLGAVIVALLLYRVRRRIG